MPVSPTYPGVYVQEVPSGVRTITGVSTSIALFLGHSTRGPINKPVRILNYSRFRDAFGEDSSASELPHYVRLFFLNGGTHCYVMRLAHQAKEATLTLNNEAGNPALKLTAKDAGAMGNNIRVQVTYSGAQPEATFNLKIFRWDIDASGRRTMAAREVWRGLTMNPDSATYAAEFLKQNSKLVNAEDLTTPPSTQGRSISGRYIDKSDFEGLFATIPRTFEISVGGSPYVLVTIETNKLAANDIAKAINDALNKVPSPKQIAPPTIPAGKTASRVTFEANNPGDDVFIRPSGRTDDVAVELMLGTVQGGVEISAYADRRPAPSGLCTIQPGESAFDGFANLDRSFLQTATPPPTPPEFNLQLARIEKGLPVDESLNLLEAKIPGNAKDKVFKDNYPSSPNGNSDGLRQVFGLVAKYINEYAPASGRFPWRAEVWGSRLAILPGEGFDDGYVPPVPSNTNCNPSDFLGLFGTPAVPQSHYFSLSGGNDGNAPTKKDYVDCQDIIDRDVDLFNLMVLPPFTGTPALPVNDLYADASVFCQRRRAFLLMDAPADWSNAQGATMGVAKLRIGLVKDHSAVFYPRLTIDDRGLRKNIGPAGVIAGLCARTDGTRGVWKAPAGIEADLRGIVGVEQRFSDGENGILNPRAINTIRVFPSGIVNWGARTNQGDDDTPHDYKYIPIRRLALYMEESLYRGLKWAVFEPNDEPLWAQIRLNVGAFMHNLFRQGAFQGRTPKDAYFVKCDGETTTQNDRNLGIVNVWVGFAPLKPAEFVILYLQQMAGQIDT